MTLVAALGVGALLVAVERRWRSDDRDVGEARSLSVELAEQTLQDYLTALSVGDYAAASSWLAGGDEPLEERPDLAALDVEVLSTEALTQALARYCQDGCVEPTGVVVGSSVDDTHGYEATADFGEPRGHPVQRPFVVGVAADGERYVRGLPPAELSPIPAAP